MLWLYFKRKSHSSRAKSIVYGNASNRLCSEIQKLHTHSLPSLSLPPLILCACPCLYWCVWMWAKEGEFLFFLFLALIFMFLFNAMRCFPFYIQLADDFNTNYTLPLPQHCSIRHTMHYHSNYFNFTVNSFCLDCFVHLHAFYLL